MNHAFGSGEPFSVGVEEELLLVTAGGRPADDADEVLAPGSAPACRARCATSRTSAR
jgi:hypothetical protein